MSKCWEFRDHERLLRVHGLSTNVAGLRIISKCWGSWIMSKCRGFRNHEERLRVYELGCGYRNHDQVLRGQGSCTSMKGLECWGFRDRELSVKGSGINKIKYWWFNSIRVIHNIDIRLDVEVKSLGSIFNRWLGFNQSCQQYLYNNNMTHYKFWYRYVSLSRQEFLKKVICSLTYHNNKSAKILGVNGIVLL